MKSTKKLPVSIRLFLAGLILLIFLIFLIKACFFSSGTSVKSSTSSSFDTAPYAREETGTASLDDTGTKTPDTNQTEEESKKSPYLLDTFTLDEAAAQLGSTVFRLPFTLKDMPCEYISYDNRNTIPETVSKDQLHILTVCINDSYFNFQIYTDTDCLLEDAPVTGVSETGDVLNPDHLYLPNGICVGKSTDTLTNFSSSNPFFGSITHQYQDTLGQCITIYSQDGIITSAGIYVAK